MKINRPTGENHGPHPFHYVNQGVNPEQKQSMYAAPGGFAQTTTSQPNNASKGCLGCLVIIMAFIGFVTIIGVISSLGSDSDDTSTNTSTSTAKPSPPSPKPSKTVSQAEVNAAVDKMFVQEMRKLDTESNLTDEQIVSVAKRACQRIDGGDTVFDLVADVMQIPEYLQDDTTKAIGGGIGFYCPEHQEEAQAQIEAFNSR